MSFYNKKEIKFNLCFYINLNFFSFLSKHFKINRKRKNTLNV